MPIRIPASDTPLVLDTLPAYKVRSFTGTPGAGKLYCYARLYSPAGGLAMGLWAFEREPAAASHIGFALYGGGPVLYLDATRDAAQLHRLSGEEQAPQQAGEAELLCTLPTGYFRGVDEQGWFWGVELTLSAALLRQAGCPLQGGFDGALYKYHAREDAFGTSLALPENANPLDPAYFDHFTIVPPV